ncbi:exo-alpha-sialidase [Hoyosella rhizosphaerae]|uniref:F510_1955 family glycosylhydrolase n=1 Tax=Hoyosella rhizosphaerae TaxID=1755582 RepID=UPI00166D9E33|nr:exo-alpha-sialidase [Hoyosella rhizosphaerae]MBN4926708.1 exo-alpha-sialidase [Hoyosella rhizosphaerae]
MRRTFRIAVASLAMALAVSGCGVFDRAEPPYFGHIHALATNANDDSLYIASHFGVFRYDGGTPRLHSDVEYDFMSLANAGPDHFYASGHPSPDDLSQPINLGLIESTDGAQTWSAVSLAGEADFHALAVRHGTIYGFDSVSGTIMRSEDATDWEQLATLEARHIAIDPVDPNHILVTAQTGLHRSIDGGSTFAVVENAPAIAHVDWLDATTLIGIDISGTVVRSSRTAQHWDIVSDLGAVPHALTIDPAGDIYVATESTIARSADGGETFTAIHDY